MTTKKKGKESKYDSGINILGSIPNYAKMLDFISDTYGFTHESKGTFEFRTEKSVQRFIGAIEASILLFKSDGHKHLFFSALADKEYSDKERLMILFWQLTYSNRLFNRITKEIFMKAVYAGRITITADETLGFLRYIKEQEPGELQWSEGTLKITASKYLTIMKKLGLSDGATKKEILRPVITSRLFVYFIRFVQQVCPEDRTLHNPFIIFGFHEEQSLINRLKKIENIPNWDISQIGNEIIIDLK